MSRVNEIFFRKSSVETDINLCPRDHDNVKRERKNTINPGEERQTNKEIMKEEDGKTY